MSKYKVLIQYSNGASEEDDSIFNTVEEAEDYGNYLISCYYEGAEILNLSNPGDYPLDDFDEPDFEVVEIED